MINSYRVRKFGTSEPPLPPAESPSAVTSVTFLLTVNDTWYPDEYHKKCLQTVKTPPLQPNQQWNKTQSIAVGVCDHGPLLYTITDEGVYV